MDTTSESLLFQLKDVEAGSLNHADAWSRFVKLYTPLIFYWARKTGLQSQDASDLVQDVMTIVIRKLPEFEYDATRSFRGWLRTITLNKYREQLRKRAINVVEASGSFLGRLIDENQAESTWDLNYAQELVAQAIELMKDDFAPETWKALKMWMASGRPVGEISEACGVSSWTIYSARSRLLQRLRGQLEGLLE